VRYWGSIKDSEGDPGPEILARITAAHRTCTALKPVWGSGALTRRQAAAMVDQRTMSPLTYGLHTMYYHDAWARRIDSTQARCL